MTKIKICGITNIEDAQFCIEAGVDVLGFIFAPESPRKINIEDAKTIIKNLPPFISKVGVFANQSKQEILDILAQIDLDYIQLHGQESVEFCLEFPKHKLIKAFKVQGQIIPEYINNYQAAGYLFDSAKKDLQKGISMPFKWEYLLEIKNKLKEKVILSGGLNPENVGYAVEMVKPYAVDVCAGVEEKIGKKDKVKVRDFIREVKITDSRLSLSQKFSSILKEWI